MLKYRINQINILGDRDKLSVNDSFSADLSDDDKFYADSQRIVMCYCDDLGKLQEDARVLVKHTVPEYNMTIDEKLVQKTHDYYTVKGVNQESRMFSLKYNKFMYLPLLEVQTRFDEIVDESDEGNDIENENIKGDKYVYFYFSCNHLFDDPYDLEPNDSEVREEDDEDDDVEIEEDESDVLDNEDDDVEEDEEIEPDSIWVDYIDSNGARKFIKINCLYENESALKIKWDDLACNDSVNGLLDVLFTPDINGKINNRGNKNGITIYRETLRFSMLDGFSVYYTNPKTSIQIALTSNAQTDLVKESLIEEYVDKTKRDVINNFIDGEKNICFPVVALENNNVITYSDAVRIDFNLHFRKRSQENWISDANDYWNGVKKSVTVKNGISQQELTLDSNYFSYPNNKEEQQSDLLSYLNFDYNDVKYQKNKIKKSFIRISYYDSINPAKQNLLAYSTIFIDGGNLYGKLLKNINNPDYYTIGANNLRKKVTGINVNTEYDVKNNTNMSVDEIEKYRLSSQLSVSNPNSSNASSEGFYFYLWKDILDSMPEEGLKLYAKIEFHHAGLGRTVPFMMPFWDKNKHVGEGDEKDKVEGIKTFREILADYSTPKGNIITGTNKKSDGPYEIKQYLKFSYICMRVKWDETMKKYIYFLDNSTYGTDAAKFDDNIIRINLYEGMITQ